MVRALILKSRYISPIHLEGCSQTSDFTIDRTPSYTIRTYVSQIILGGPSFPAQNYNQPLLSTALPNSWEQLFYIDSPIDNYTILFSLCFIKEFIRSIWVLLLGLLIASSGISNSLFSRLVSLAPPTPIVDNIVPSLC